MSDTPSLRMIFQLGGMTLLGWLCLTGSAYAQEAPLSRQHWKPVYYGSLMGKQALLFNDSAFNGKPTLADLDGDGDMDLLVGKQDGRINRYENQGMRFKKKNPSAAAKRIQWRLVAEDMLATAWSTKKTGERKRRRQRIDVGDAAAPALVDLDQDGDADLLVGNARGQLFYFRNAGTPVLASWELVSDALVPPHFGRHLTPALKDIDGDLAYDLLLGNARGRVFLLPNTGTKHQHRFCARFPPPEARPHQPLPCQPTPKEVTSTAPEGYAAPALADWDGDGDADLFVGKRDGTISYHENTGTARLAAWRFTQQHFLAIDDGGHAAPTFAELNGDQRPDLLAGTNSNRIITYTNKGTGQVLDIWKITNNLLSVQRLNKNQGNIHISSGDLDGDGDVDLILGDEDGRLAWVENTGKKSAPAWRMKEADMFKGTFRSGSAPLLIDLDKDGDLDLLVGGRDGMLWLVQNEGSAKQPRWRLADTAYGGIDVGSHSVPLAQDVDKDGDLDLIIGNGQGFIIHYTNRGSPQQPAYQLTSTYFGNITVGRDASPVFFDWNEDKRPDLIVGNRNGLLALVESRGKNAPSWKLLTRNWENFRFKGASKPHFSDINGDQRPDLLVADGKGNLRLWLNEPLSQEAPTAAKKSGEAPSLSAKNPAGGPAAVGTQEGSPPPLNLGPTPLDTAQGAIALSNLLAVPNTPKGPTPPRFVLSARAYGGLQFSGRIVPAFLDLDGDGDLDMVVGTRRGELIHYRNLGPLENPRWQEITRHFADYRYGHNAHPLFADLDGDERSDLLVGSEDGRVHFFKGMGTSRRRRFVHQANKLITVNVGRSGAPALLRLKAVNTPVLLMGGFSGKVSVYDAPGRSAVPIYRRAHRSYIGLDVGVAATPYIGDIDQDDKLDLLVGSDQGNVYHYKQVPTGPTAPWGWQKEGEYLKSLRFPTGSSPRLADIDNDGDTDLFVGSEGGRIYFYRNKAQSP